MSKQEQKVNVRYNGRIVRITLFSEEEDGETFWYVRFADGSTWDEEDFYSKPTLRDLHEIIGVIMSENEPHEVENILFGESWERVPEYEVGNMTMYGGE